MKTAPAAVIAAIVLTCSLLAPAEPTYSGGDGSVERPFQIADVNDFLELSATPTHWDKHFILTANLDLTDHPFTQAPIAPDTSPSQSYFQGTAFAGVFNGGGHAITKLTIVTPDSDYIGLFGFVGYTGQLKNLGIENVNIYGRNSVGGLAGSAEGTIENCYSTGSVNGINNIGGLIGFNASTMSNCYSLCSVIGIEANFGGLCGFNGGTIAHCYAAGSVAGGDSAYNIGGLCGWNTSLVTIIHCYATGDVTGGDSSYNIGGLCGDNSGGAIRQCYSTGAVQGGTSAYNLGGLCGFQGWEGSLIADSFWDMETSNMAVGYNLHPSYPGVLTNVVGKTTTEMRTLSTFVDAGWSCIVGDATIGDWVIADNSYPKLVWEAYPQVAIPIVKGLTEQQAKTVFDTAGIRVGSSFYVFDDTVSPGLASHTYPVTGTIVYAGLTPVHILLSKDTKYAGGNGETSPYQIADLDNFFELINTPADWCRSFELANNLNLAGLVFTQAPIAPSYNSIFTGSFEGSNHVISNLFIKTSIGDRIGLFGSVSGDGEIINLGLENLNISGRTGVGGLVGSGGIVTNCYTTGSVSGGSSVGGLAGSGQTITNSFSHCSVTGTVYLGGLSGYISQGTITNSYSTGSVGGAHYIGGLVGTNYRSKIIRCYSVGKISGSDRIGGLCGFRYTGGSYEDTRNYWDKETSETTSSQMGSGKTTAEMQTQATFITWDFTDTWAICEGTNYPRLRWSIPAADWVCPDGVDGADFAHLAAWWLVDDCALQNDCDGADLNLSGDVGLYELLILAELWLK